MRPSYNLNTAERFFWSQASKPDNMTRKSQAQGMKYAKALAEAEQAFLDAQAYANWAFKIVPDEPATEKEGAPRWRMYIEDTAGRIMALLGDVSDNGADFSRLVRAGLALALLRELKAAAAAERDD